MAFRLLSKVIGMKGRFLILSVVLLATPVWAATPKTASKPAAKTKPAAATPVLEAPLSADDLVRQAQAAKSRGENDLALRLAQAAIVADPARPASYDALGTLYASGGDSDFARFYFNRALSIDPTDADAVKSVAALDRSDRTAKADTLAK
jgi:tetratricopeptide (TPR) repeat protein